MDPLEVVESFGTAWAGHNLNAALALDHRRLRLRRHRPGPGRHPM